jgi:hypothetical protein
VLIVLRWDRDRGGPRPGTVLGWIAGLSGGPLALPAIVFRALRWPDRRALLAPAVHWTSSTRSCDRRCSPGTVAGPLARHVPIRWRSGPAT